MKVGKFAEFLEKISEKEGNRIRLLLRFQSLLFQFVELSSQRF